MEILMTTTEDSRAPPGQRKGRPAGAAHFEIRNGNSADFKLTALRAQAEARLRRQRLAEIVWKGGARVFFEFLDELDRYHGLGDDLDRRLQRYSELNPDLLRAVGGDRFPPAPIFCIDAWVR
jgi:hypothetical protein